MRGSVPLTYTGLHNQPTSAPGMVATYDPGGGLVAVDDGTDAVRVVTDRHRDVVATLGDDGAVIDSVAYDPWANVIHQ